jgi:hypothetical protein
MTMISSADIVQKHVQFVLQVKGSKMCFLLTPVNTTEYYDNMALVKRQDRNIFLDWETVIRDTDKSENQLTLHSICQHNLFYS